MTTVYVLSKNGKPLMPTTRCGHVRILLKEKKARVVEKTPFTIQLTYETEEVTQPLILGHRPREDKHWCIRRYRGWRERIHRTARHPEQGCPEAHERAQAI